MLGFGTVAALVARSVLARTRVGRLPLVRPLLGRSVAVSLALASSAWMLRILVGLTCMTALLMTRVGMGMAIEHGPAEGSLYAIVIPITISSYCSDDTNERAKAIYRKKTRHKCEC